MSATRIRDIALIAFAALIALFEGPAQIACAIAVAACLWGAARDRTLDRTALLIGGLILLYALAGVYGAATATVRLRSEDTLRPLMALGFIAGAYGYRRASDPILKRAALAFCACIVLNGAYGFLQLGFGELPLDRFFLKNPHSSQLWVPDHIYDHTSAHPSGIRALSGLFYNRLKLAHLGVIGLGALALIAAARVDRKIRFLAIAGTIILFSALIFTYARAALAAFLVALLVVVLASMQARVVAALAGVSALGLGVAFAASEYLRERAMNAASDLELRGQIFAAAARMFADHPILGLGHGVYRTQAAAYYPAGASTTWLIDAHNLLLHVAAETGIAGLMGFLGALLLASVRVIRRVRRDRLSSRPGAVLDRFALFGLTAIVILGMTHFPLHHAPVALAFWTLLGVAGGAERTDGEG